MKLVKKIEQQDFDVLHDLEARFVICESYKSVIRSILSNSDINIDKARFDKYAEDYIEIFAETQMYRNNLIQLYLPSHLYNIDNLISFIDQTIIVETDNNDIQNELISIGYVAE